jgi:hypothetical protein
VGGTPLGHRGIDGAHLLPGLPAHRVQRVGDDLHGVKRVDAAHRFRGVGAASRASRRPNPRRCYGIRIAIRTCADEAPDAPGVIEADTVAHCGPTLIGEFARTLTMTDVVIGWTENHSIRNNASKWIVEGIEELQQWFPFAMAIFDSDCGGEFINHDVAGWLQTRDIEQTRSRPYQKNDQAHVESKNNHVVRKHAFYWRYDGQELELLNRLWRLVSLRLNFFTPTKKPVGYTTTANGRRTRIYDKPATPWQRLKASGVLDTKQLSNVAARIEGINPADLTRQINTIQMQLLDLAKAKTEALAAARHINLEALDPSINRLAKAK